MHTDKIIFILIFLSISEKSKNIYKNIKHLIFLVDKIIYQIIRFNQCRCLVPVMIVWDYLYKRPLKGTVGIKVRLLGLFLWLGTCTILYLYKNVKGIIVWYLVSDQLVSQPSQPFANNAFSLSPEFPGFNYYVNLSVQCSLNPLSILI